MWDCKIVFSLALPFSPVRDPPLAPSLFLPLFCNLRFPSLSVLGASLLSLSGVCHMSSPHSVPSSFRIPPSSWFGNPPTPLLAFGLGVSPSTPNQRASLPPSYTISESLLLLSLPYRSLSLRYPRLGHLSLTSPSWFESLTFTLFFVAVPLSPTS